MVPETVLLDAPMSLADYRPGNYDRRYRGRIGMGLALQKSLNTPAVRTLRVVGVARAGDMLRRCGIRSLRRPAEEYGLALALGGGEVSLLELAVAYGVLARSGVYLPPVFRLSGEGRTVPQRVLPVGVASLLSGVLSERPLPGLPERCLAWKTGTSNGLRDAWCVGYNRDVVVAVWLGNKSGHPAPGLVGAAAAMPVLADIAQRRFLGRTPQVPDIASGVVDVRLCAETGLRATPACARQVCGRAAAGIPLRPCPACGMSAGASSVAILRPRPGVYRAEAGDGIELPLTATGRQAVSWFVDGRLVCGETMPRSQWFSRGRHSVRCVGEGGADVVAFEVR
jgi:penicillin-binding protein 1C